MPFTNRFYHDKDDHLPYRSPDEMLYNVNSLVRYQGATWMIIFRRRTSFGNGGIQYRNLPFVLYTLQRIDDEESIIIERHVCQSEITDCLVSNKPIKVIESDEFKYNVNGERIND